MNPIRSTFVLLMTAPALAQTPAAFQDEVKTQPTLPDLEPDLKTELWTPPTKQGSTPGNNLHLSVDERAALDASFDETRGLEQAHLGNPLSEQPLNGKLDPESPVIGDQLFAMERPDWQQHFQLDEPGDGNLWAFGGTYKARFNEQGAQYIPFLGSSAPQNYPVDITLDSITLAGETLHFDAEVMPSFQGQTAVFDRGSVSERYELAAGQMEQLFVFDSLPGTGEMVVRMNVETELAADATSDYLEFAGELGSVRYGMATVLDAAGNSAPAPTSLVAGGIEIRVPASFVAGATLPLTIDPVVETFIINNDSTDDDTVPDVAFDFSTSRFAICWQRVWSSTDRDVWCELRSSTGTLIAASGDYVDFTTSDWTNPNIANNRIASQFLVVAERGAYPDTDIYGRTREANSSTMGGQFQISTGSGDKRNPDVGGDPHTAGPTYYCVAWERVWNIADDHDIHARLVRSSSTLLGTGAILIDNSVNSYDKYPGVSPSDGVPSAATQEWNIVWQRQYNSTDWDIRGAQVHWNGSVTESSFSVDFSSSNDWFPEASSPLDYQLDGPRTWMAVYRRDNFGDYDIEATVWKGANYVNDMNLSSQLTGSSQDQFDPTIDTNGHHFAVAWNEYYSTSTVDRDVYIASFYVSGNDVHVSEGKTNLAFSADPEYQVQMCARQSGGLNSDWSMVVWRDGDFGDGDLEGAVYEQPDYFGVNIGTNYCGSSTNSSGRRADIHATGSAIAGGQPLNLQAFDLPYNKFGQMMCSPNGAGSFNPPGSQGTFCLALPYGRFNAPSQILYSGSDGRFNLDVNTNDMPMSPHAPVLAGQTWRFQGWFRDNNPSLTSNFTDGVAVTFH
ncbi:MAG: hypothetical protein GY711_35185 [bacterium]|nr:hypothetical protein [bacterium]